MTEQMAEYIEKTKKRIEQSEEKKKFAEECMKYSSLTKEEAEELYQDAKKALERLTNETR